ncbi:hypothetical protein Q8A73_023150 [Channa argus]|nr:hypothetical protein Q8A73_023150 [Channa argus]
MKRPYTLTQLFHHFLEEAKESGISNFAKYKLVLIFDGLDECRLPLDFKSNEPCYSVSEPASVDVLLTNLIKGNLLPTAHIWITSRPAAADRIPADLVNRVTEIRGFNDPQKEEFADWGQVLCKEVLTDRCYWEVEWTGDWTGIGVAYKGISRKEKGNECVLGYNDQSWSLRYCRGKYTAWYDKTDEAIAVPYFSSKRTGVFLDWSAGTLSFYAVSPNAMTHLHTFHTQFSEPLYAGFRLGFLDSSLTLCQQQ